MDIIKLDDSAMRGKVQPKACWNSCADDCTGPSIRSRRAPPAAPAASVPATLALTLGTPAAFGAFTPGIAKDYTAAGRPT